MLGSLCLVYQYNIAKQLFTRAQAVVKRAKSDTTFQVLKHRCGSSAGNRVVLGCFQRKSASVDSVFTATVLLYGARISGILWNASTLNFSAYQDFSHEKSIRDVQRGEAQRHVMVQDEHVQSKFNKKCVAF